jgi:hypothetical protein
MTRAADLTRALTAPPIAPIDDDTRLALRDRLVSAIGPIVEYLPPGDDVVVNLPLLRQARTCPELLSAPPEAFAWKPLFVRRSLGLAIVRSCVSGRFRTPMEAAAPVSEEALIEWQRTGWRTFHWEPWFAGLAPGARATVLADAVSWATPLWSALEWGAIPGLPVVGGVDDQWTCPAPRPVRLKGRSELRVAVGGDRAWPDDGGLVDQPVALVSMSGGRSRAPWAEELAFLALAAALRSPSRPVPARVLGLWPDSGTHSVVDITSDTLMAAVDLVVATVDAVVESRLTGETRAVRAA